MVAANRKKLRCAHFRVGDLILGLIRIEKDIYNADQSN